jgi:hypothetical protein
MPRRLPGTCFIRPNQPGLGAHSQQWAIGHGLRAMQFNLAVSTNERAIRLWERLGFQVVGRLPGAFRHARLGFIDARVMFKTQAR